MSKDIITLYDESGNKEDYKLLLVIDKGFKYLIYTDINNFDIKNNLYAVKINGLNRNEETVPIDDDEWEMIEKTYQEFINI